MGIVDFFRPKYRHSDVRVRLEAVLALSSDDHDILAAIVRTDRELSVRRAALDRLDEASVLASLAEDVTERSLRERATTRAAEIWVKAACQQDDEDEARAALDGLVRLGDQRAIAEVAREARLEGVQSRALDKIDDPRALAELAKTTNHAVLRSQALAAIRDPEVLRAVAVDTKNRELGMSALERISDPEALEHVAQRAKNEKVRGRARKRVEELAEAERAKKPKVSDETKRRRAEQAQLLRELEGVVDTHEWEASGKLVAKVETGWRELGQSEEDAIQERFEKALARYKARRAAATAQVEQQRQEAEAARAYERATQDAERARRAEQLTEKTPTLSVEVPTGWAQDAAPSMPAPAPAPAISDEERAARKAEADARKQEMEERGAQIAASLDALISDLVSMNESKDGRAIDRLLGQATRAFEQVTRAPSDRRADLETRYREARAALVIRIQELREAQDWEQWSNVPRAEALITEAKALLEAEELPELNALKALQQRWKSVGVIPRNKNNELWERFKTTCDQVFERVKARRAVENEQHDAAVKVKEELVAKAEALSESTDWEVTAEAFKELQRLWKESGTVPRRVGDALWRKFRGACDRFFERRKPILEDHLAGQEENLVAKRALIARAEAVTAAAPGEAGWGPAIDEIKQLQRQWKDIGHVPRKDADEVYRTFRAACDGLFDKRDATRDAEVDALRAELGAVRADVDAVTGADGATAAAKLLSARGKLRDLGERGVRADDALADAIDRATREVIAAHPAALAGSELDPVAMSSKRTKLLAKAEELLPKARPAVDAGASAEQIVAQLKSAMQSNALGDFRGAGVDPFEAVDELRGQWRAIGPVVGADAEDLERRFLDACERILEGAKAEGKQRREREPRGERGDRGDRGGDREPRARRERRPRRDAAEPAAAAPAPASAAPVVVSGPDAVTIPVALPVAAAVPVAVAAPVAVAVAVAAPVAVAAAAPVAASAPVPAAVPVAVPVAEAAAAPAAVAAAPVDDAWDAEDPTAAPEEKPPTAGEMASDGAPEGDGIDAGWD